MKRVMILTNSQSGGGAERSMNLVANELTTLGYKVYLVAINLGPEDLIKPKFDLIQLERNWKDGFLSTLHSLISFKKNIRKINPDVLIVNCELPELFASLVNTKCKIIVVEHTSRPWNGRRSIGFVVRYALKMKKTLWVKVSENIGNWPFNFTSCKIIPNPIKNLGINTDRDVGSKRLTNLYFVGRLSQEKNPELFLKLCKNLNLSGTLIGDGILKDALISYSKSNQIAVSFKGYLSDPWAEIGKGDLLIIPSIFEGDGLVVVEAIHQGIPLLISDNLDFRRFNLPERNYCADEADFQERIRFYASDISTLQVEERIASRIINGRNINEVAKSWSLLIENTQS